MMKINKKLTMFIGLEASSWKGPCNSLPIGTYIYPIKKLAFGYILMKKEHFQVGHQQHAYPNLCTSTLETEMHFIYYAHMAFD
jgi:hypothetical protein